jgi:putative addiction module component (TIGR02574 family)
MTTKADFILNEALSMSPAERAMLAHCLISSLDQPKDKNVDAEWIRLAQKRLVDLENGSVEPVSWESIKQKVRE